MEMEFKRVRSVRDIIISAVLTVGGLLLAILPSSTSLTILGCVLAILGIILILALRSDFKDVKSGMRFSKKVKYFPASKKSEVLAALKSDLSAFDWTEQPSSNGLMVDIYKGKGDPTVFVRVSEFIPYSYVPCSEWFSYKADVASPMLV